jgi:hypothetical protein
MSGVAALRRMIPLVALLLATSCGHRAATDLDALVRRDSVYLTPGTLEPFSGPVVRYFEKDPGHVQIEGVLQDGRWEGEMTVYHESGRVRYQGRLSRGAPCGTWLDNRDDEPAGSVYEELTKDIASMGIYPPCPDG